MQHPDEGTIHAWIDGQLPAEEAAALEAHAGECADCRAAIADARGIIAASSRIVSALDIVPGGVIPVEEKTQKGFATQEAQSTEAQNLERARRMRIRKPWYASTQLRAAAAVLFVAAASLVVVRQRGTNDIRTAAGELRAVPDVSTAETRASESLQSTADGAAASSPAPAAVGNVAGAPPRQALTAKEAAPRAAAPQEADMQQSTRRSGAEATRTAEKSITGPAAPAISAPAPTSQAASSAPLRLEGAVVTGAAAAPPMARDAARSAEIELLRADTTGTVVTKTYRLPEGVEVTLTETSSISGEFSGKGVMERERRLQAQGAARASTTAAPPVPPSRRDSTIQAPVMSIRWTNPATNRLYILSGAVSRERLEAIRKEIERR